MGFCLTVGTGTLVAVEDGFEVEGLNIIRVPDVVPGAVCVGLLDGLLVEGNHPDDSRVQGDVGDVKITAVPIGLLRAGQSLPGELLEPIKLLEHRLLNTNHLDDVVLQSASLLPHLLPNGVVGNLHLTGHLAVHLVFDSQPYTISKLS